MKIKGMMAALTFGILINLSGCAMKKSEPIGRFESATDVGSVKTAGESQFDTAAQTYRLRGSGSNMWFGEDAFHFLWKRISGDFILDGRITWVGDGQHEHRKAGFMIRETLAPGSRHVSSHFHAGDGLMSLQYRLETDSVTLQQSAEARYLPVMRLEKSGTTLRMFAARPGEPMQRVGEVEFSSDSSVFYTGLFVCSHDSDVVEEAVFSNVRLTIPVKKDFIPYQDYIGCRLEILDIESGSRRILYQSGTPFEAPNWSGDGSFLVVNSQGKLYRIPAEGGELTLIDTDFATSNNNDHGFSPDGTRLAISHHAADRPDGQNSVIYTVPVTGGIPRQITDRSPSYWHGWSPDGNTLIYTANRNDQWDIYGIPAAGGPEFQLTDNPNLDDGSQYSSDGRFIWFNSNRSGSMEIWRMKADGTEQTQITRDSYQNWFPHESPDGKWLIFLSYPPEVDSWDHPYYQKVMLRMIRLEDMHIRVVAYLYGGQGTINVPSWSPDSKRVAFVSNSDGLAE